MRINHNIAALNTYRQLTSNSANGSKSLEKLSSGLRINKAGDDAAGLAISEKMRAQIRGLDQASRNAQDGISMIQTAEGALNETHSILQRMRELANQASNDTNVNVDRTEIQKELNQLTSEINRIGNTTEFNTQKLLDGGGSIDRAMTVVTATEGGAAGRVTSIDTITASKTGKSVMTINIDATRAFTIEASTAGTDLNGIQFNFDSTTVAGKGVAKVGNVVTVRFAATSTATQIQNLINGTGVVTSPVKVSMTNPTTGAALGSAVPAAIESFSGTMAGGEASETRGVYSFDVSSAFVNTGNNFVLKVPTSANPDTWASVTLTASTATGSTTFAIGSVGDRLDSAAQAANIRTALASNGSISGIYDVSVSGTKVVLTEKSGQAQGDAVELTSNTGTAAAGKMSYTHSAQKMVEVGGSFSIDGVDIRVVDGTGENDTADIASGRAIMLASGNGDTFATQIDNLQVAITRNSDLNSKYTATDDNAGTLTLKQNAGFENSAAATITTSTGDGSGFQASFQIGANTQQSMTIEVNDMRSAALKVAGNTASAMVTAQNGSQAYYVASKNVTNGTDNSNVEYSLDVSSHSKATAAISVIQDAIESVSAERSKLGAYQNRLEHTINNLGTSSENMTAAESRIRDVDMAKEMMEFTKNNILSQAAQAMLAQANQQPQGVLQLLR